MAARAMAVGGPGEGKWGVHWLLLPSAVGSQLCLNVHSADGAFLAHGEPLVHTQLMKEMHTGEAPGRGQGKWEQWSGGRVPCSARSRGKQTPRGTRRLTLRGSWGPCHGVSLWLGWECMMGRRVPRPPSSWPSNSKPGLNLRSIQAKRPSALLAWCPGSHTMGTTHPECSTLHTEHTAHSCTLTHVHRQTSKHFPHPDTRQRTGLVPGRRTGDSRGCALTSHLLHLPAETGRSCISHRCLTPLPPPSCPSHPGVFAGRSRGEHLSPEADSPAGGYCVYPRHFPLCLSASSRCVSVTSEVLK